MVMDYFKLEKIVPVNKVIGACATAFVGLGVAILIRRKWRKNKSQYSVNNGKKLIVITGCDSGLGFSMAYWAAKSGFRVLAACYDESSEGALYLKAEFGTKEVTLIKVDVTLPNELENLATKCEHILTTEQVGLWAVIPNAAIAVFGEFFWHTTSQSRRIMDVNFHGAINLVHLLHHLILRHKCRVIVISSDCANIPLPGLPVYCASKAALFAWTESLRLEVEKYGVSVVSLQPGNFPTTTRLFSGQAREYEEMKHSMNPEDKIFFGEYFDNYNKRIINLMGPSKLQPLEDKTLKQAFFDLLTDDIRYISLVRLNPKSLTVIHFLIQNAPTKVKDFLLNRLVCPLDWRNMDYPKTSKSLNAHDN